MDGLIVFGVIAFVLYRFFRSTTPDQRQNFLKWLEEQQQKSGQQTLSDASRTSIPSPAESAESQTTEVMFTRISDQSKANQKKEHQPFEKERWRRQLFIYSLLILVGYLVYLVLV